MPTPQSPFDEPDPEGLAEETSPATRPGLPPRKYSFMVLGMVLFVLVWVREWTRMPGPVALLLTVAILAGWAIVHGILYGTFARLRDGIVSRLPSRSAGTRRPAHPATVRLAALGGLILGIWLPYYFRGGPVGLTVLVVVLLLFVYLVELVLVRR